ncbi:Aldo/keto reductase [Paenibacillus sophorae]|uniref:Aldo/keto reductase n=1 Tax=Paenibacillus sophorae TaxID=1333845 RepID=A0A1H8SE54_9BACL|nr:aldo/keto reductase [Paenibacillus sophorae]QWU16730.1 aldo/keto reductase [Paenibacillus sophorae]SEO77329.1 Aldo/keto reductase [Paenibacillus sophorae]
MNYFILNNGMKIPVLGFGVWNLKDTEQCKSILNSAIQAGYRLIDTASAYLNETAVGEAIKESGVKRYELFVTSKLWVQDTGYEKTKEAFERTLQRLGLDYLDMYLIHWPYGDIAGSWKAMEELYHEGKIKAIGVSNFSIGEMQNLLEIASVKPVVNQVECHPLFQQKELRAFLKENEIYLDAWFPLGSGNKDLLEHPQLKPIADKYGKENAQIILRWHMQEGAIALPKSTKPERIASNFAIWDFELTEQEMNVIRSIDTNKRLSNNPEDEEVKKKITSWVLDI